MAGNDLAARAATVQSDGAIAARAGRDLTIESGEANYASDYTRKSSSSGFLSKKRTTIHSTSESTTAIASTFSGDSVTLIANRDIGVRGSNVVATNDTTIAAGGDIVIASAIDTARSSHVREKTKTGAFSTGLDATSTVREAQRAQGSVISAGRDLSITAGAHTKPESDGMSAAIVPASSRQGHLIIQGSAIDAGRDLAIQTTGGRSCWWWPSQTVDELWFRTGQYSYSAHLAECHDTGEWWSLRLWCCWLDEYRRSHPRWQYLANVTSV